MIKYYFQLQDSYPSSMIFQKSIEVEPSSLEAESTCLVLEGENIFFRLLLHHGKESTFYEDVRTVDDDKCTSFRESRRRAGLLLDKTDR